MEFHHVSRFLLFVIFLSFWVAAGPTGNISRGLHETEGIPVLVAKEKESVILNPSAGTNSSENLTASPGALDEGRLAGDALNGNINTLLNLQM